MTGSNNGKIDAFMLSMISYFKMDIADFCDIETIDGHDRDVKCLVANDGSLATIIKFHGSKSVMSREQFDRLVELLELSLASYFRHKGHQIQVVFRRDLDARRPLEDNANQQKQTASTLRLDMNYLIDEVVEKYLNYVYDENCYFVLWSRPSLLDAKEVQIDRAEKARYRSKHNTPSMRDAQNLFLPVEYMYNRHAAFVGKIYDDLSSPEFGCSVEKLDLDGMLREIKRSLYPDSVPDNWKPSYPSSKIPFRWKSNSVTSDASELLYPSIPRQIMTQIAQIGQHGNRDLPDPTTVRLGNRVFAPVFIEIPPSEPQIFTELFSILNRAECTDERTLKKRSLPYAISIMLEADGLNGLGFKKLLANVLGATSLTNRNINASMKQLDEDRQDNLCIAKARISAMTWALTGEANYTELALRKSKLISALSAWGSPVVIERTGNPMLAMQSTATALTMKHAANPWPVPLGQALAMLPLTRPASAFAQGSTIYRSKCGKIMPYQRFSSEQTTWITLVSGKPGSGKSVLLNYNHIESCIMPGMTRLPYICVIDIGVSSKGFIDLIQDALPEDLKYMAFYKRLQMTKQDAINPFDTSLGSREPLPKDRSFLVNFITMLATPPERGGRPYEGMTNFVGRVIDATYRYRSDLLETGTPVGYLAGYSTVIDNAIAQLGIDTNLGTTYWSLVDTFFEKGMIYEAEVAQRMAMPKLQDLVGVANQEMKEEYGNIKVESGSGIIQAFCNGINEAISEFPIFSSETQFDIGSARVMSIDLQDLALVGSDSNKKQTSLMYMIARQVFMKKVAFSAEDLPLLNPKYRRYFEQLINDITEDKKVLCMDEYHKTGRDEILTTQVLTDGREARKWNLEIILASQLMEDFGSLTKIATSYFILDAGNDQTRAWLRDNIGLSRVEENALINNVHGASAAGSTFMARFITKNSTFTQLFTLSAGSMRLWSLSTTAEDRKLRDQLFKAMPKHYARHLLAKRFPGGSCKSSVEAMQREMFNNADFVDDDMRSSVVDRLAKEMIAAYRELLTNDETETA